MRITLLILFLLSILSLFGQENDTLKFTPKFVTGSVERIQVDTAGGSAWITIDGDSTEYEFDPPDGAPSKNNNTRDADRTTTRKDTSLSLELSNRRYPIVINDEDGNQYTIYPNGTIEQSTYFNISDDYLDVTAGQTATFTRHQDESYGFDAKAHTEWHEQYEIIELSDSSKYFVANKSLAINETDNVIAKVPSVHANVTFQRQNGQEVSASPLGGGQGGGSSDSSMISYTVDITAFSSKGEHALYVYAGNNRIGKLNLHVFKEKEVDVVVVPVANVSLDSATLNNEINDIFNEANIQVNVSTAPQWNNADFTATTTIDLPSDVTNFNKYSNQMRNLRDAYFDSTDADKSKHYLFVVEGFTGSLNEEGYMVRGKGLGFVTKNATPQTYAHELGHGAGALAHTWKNSGPEQGTTDNLMDYSDSSNLMLGQWEELRKFNLVPSFWDSEEDGMNYSVSSQDLQILYDNYSDSTNTLTFLDPAGKILTLPEGLQSIRFSSPDTYWKRGEDSDKLYENETPIGSVVSFTLGNNEEYNAHRTSSGNFTGYFHLQKKFTNEQLENYSNILAGIPVIENGTVKFNVLPLDKSAVLADQNTSNQIGQQLPVIDKFKFLEDYISSNSNGTTIVADYTGQITLEALNFISSIKSEVSGKESLYAFQVAYIISKNPILNGCLGEVISLVDYDISQERESEIYFEEEALQNEFFIEPTDNYLSQSDDISMDLEEFGIQEIDDVEQSDEEYFKKFYYRLIQFLNSVTDLEIETYDAVNQSNIDIGTYSNMMFSNFNYNHIECYLSKLSLTRRIQLLNEYSEWTNGDEKERLLVQLIRTTPKTQYQDVLDELSKDNFSLLKGLNGDLWSGDNHLLFLYTALMAQEKNKANSQQIAERSNFTIHFNKNWFPSEGMVTSSTWLPNGQIQFKIVYDYNETPGSSSNSIIKEVDPYQSVLVKVKEDFQFGGLDGEAFEKGDEMLLPALFVHWMLHEQSKIEQLKVARVIIGSAAAISSTLAANPGPILMVNSVIGGIDVFFALNEDPISSGNCSWCKDILDDWNSVVMTFGAMELGVGIVKSIDNYVKYSIQFSEFKQGMYELRSNPGSFEELGQKLSSIYAKSNTERFLFGYNKFKDEIEWLLREHYLASISPLDNSSLSLSTTGARNIVKLTYTEEGVTKTVNLGYSSITSQGTVQLENLNFLDNPNATQHSLICDLQEVDFIKDGVLQKKQLSVVKTVGGEVRVMVSSAEKLVDNLNLGPFVKKIGDYQVYGNGEVFYRAMNQADFDYLVSTGNIRVPLDVNNSEIFTSPTLSYIQSSPYLDNLVVVKFIMKSGTIKKLKEIGTVKVSDVGDPLMSDLGNLPINQPGWMQSNTLFKIEGGPLNRQVNIGLGRNGEGMNRFNNNILNFQVVE